MFFLHYLMKLMFLELDEYVYSSFDRSSTTGFECNSLRTSLLTVLPVIYSMPLFGLVQTRPCGSHQLPVFLKYSVCLKLLAQLVISGVVNKIVKMSYNPNGGHKLKLLTVLLENGLGISMSWIINMSASVVWSLSKFGSTGKTIPSTADRSDFHERSFQISAHLNAMFLQIFLPHS